jgi:uncharacterized coiled-coil protein SlyX
MEASIEERVAFVEARVNEHSKAWEDLKNMLIHLDQKVDRRIDALDAKVDRRVDALDQKLSRYFLWIIGIQISILLAIIATLLK